MGILHRTVSVSLVCLTIFVSVMFVDVQPVRATVLQPHAPILIDGNSGFRADNGVTGGSGTATDPYIIQGWDIVVVPYRSPGIAIRNSDSYFVIRNMYIHST